jgi:hypothetical protein
VRLPETVTARRDFDIEVARQCMTDRTERKPYHAELREWYTLGAPDGSRSVYNKIEAHVRQAASYLFQSESVRFGPVLPPQYGSMFDPALDVFRDRLHRWFHDTRAGRTIALGVEWGHVYPTIVWKMTRSAGAPTLCLVPDPADIGVYQSDRPFNRQEAYTHGYWLAVPEFARLIAGHPNERALMDLAMREAEYGTEEMGPGAVIERIQFDNVGAPMEGGGAPVAGSVTPSARVEAPRLFLVELWAVDDRVNDWRVATLLAPGGVPQATIYARRTTLVSQIDPFIALTLSEAPDYTWGFSRVDGLTGLQEQRDDYNRKILRLLDLGLDPPLLLSGFGGLKDDRAERLRQPRGVLSSPNPNASAKPIVPQMPPEALAIKDGVDREFADAGGLPILLAKGEGDANLRAGNQVGVMATLASARIREDAMKVEYACSEIATMAALMLRDMDDDPMMLPDGTRVFPHQVPRELVMEVDSHSASPLYAAAQGAKADQLRKAGAITLPHYVEMIDPPRMSMLRAEARKLEKAAAERQQKMLQIAEMKANRGRSR